MNNSIITVSQLNRYVKNIFDENKLLSDIYIRGEISNFVNHYRSGHIYFSLKDSTAGVKAVMFSSYASLLRFTPRDGMSVIVHGSVSLYERDGAYQLYVTDIQPDGLGALSLAYEQLKTKLFEEGLFSREYKKPIPVYPKNIGVVTALGAAALQDILNILGRRYPIGNVRIYPVTVQGATAAKTIVYALDYIEKENICDVIILARGGGSLEDLWAFNEEPTVRAVFDCKIPIITGVGHETDFTLADFAADLRGATPSEAAELAARNIVEIKQELDWLEEQMRDVISNKIQIYSDFMEDYTEEYLTKLLENILADKKNGLEETAKQLDHGITDFLTGKENDLAGTIRVFESLSPLSVLSRGYTITENETGAPLRESKKDDIIITRSDNITIKSKVQSVVHLKDL